MNSPGFSSRTRFDLRTNRLSQALAARRAVGLPILDLTESNPTQAGLHNPGDLLRPLGDAAALRYEPAAMGLVEARGAVAADYRRRGRSKGTGSGCHGGVSIARSR